MFSQTDRRENNEHCEIINCDDSVDLIYRVGQIKQGQCSFREFW